MRLSICIQISLFLIIHTLYYSKSTAKLNKNKNFLNYKKIFISLIEYQDQLCIDNTNKIMN